MINEATEKTTMKTNNGPIAWQLYDAASAIAIKPGSNTDTVDLVQKIWDPETRVTNLFADLLVNIADQMGDEKVCEIIITDDGEQRSELCADFGVAAADHRSDVWEAALKLARAINDAARVQK